MTISADRQLSRMRRRGASLSGEHDTARGLYRNLALHIRTVACRDLKPAERKTRIHSERQIETLTRTIERFGFTAPMLVDAKMRIIAGHARLEAAKRLGYESVPVIEIAHLSENGRRALAIADNRLAELAEWDEPELKLEFELLAFDEDEFLIEATGFELPEIEMIALGAGHAVEADPADETPEPQKPNVSRLGDLWLLGDKQQHRLLCADAIKTESFWTLIGEERVRTVFTDPPYNVKIGGHVSGLGKVQHAEFVMASGEMSEAQFRDEFLGPVLKNLAAASVDGAVCFVCMDWRHMGELLAAGHSAFNQLLNVAVWSKPSGGMGSLYRSRHELVFVWKVGAAPHVNNVQLGRFGRNRTNVWEYAGVNTFRKGRMDELAMHPTVKPVALVADAIRDASHRGDLVLDAFCGSGTTIVAAEKTGRRARAPELDPRYVDISIRRFEALFGQPAVLASTGQSFAEVAAERATAPSAGAFHTDNDNHTADDEPQFEPQVEPTVRLRVRQTRA